MRKASHDRFGAWLRRLCTSERESRFEYYWKYVCDGVKQDLISPIIEEGDWLSPVLYSRSCIQSLNHL